jgi:hypothetical protein
MESLRLSPIGRQRNLLAAQKYRNNMPQKRSKQGAIDFQECVRGITECKPGQERNMYPFIRDLFVRFLAMIATLGCLVDGQVLTTTPGFHTSSFRPIAGLVWLFEFEGLSVVTHSPRAT